MFSVFESILSRNDKDIWRSMKLDKNVKKYDGPFTNAKIA